MAGFIKLTPHLCEGKDTGAEVVRILSALRRLKQDAGQNQSLWKEVFVSRAIQRCQGIYVSAFNPASIPVNSFSAKATQEEQRPANGNQSARNHLVDDCAERTYGAESNGSAAASAGI
jgi:hypothetical protein